MSGYVLVGPSKVWTVPCQIFIHHSFFLFLLKMFLLSQRQSIESLRLRPLRPFFMHHCAAAVIYRYDEIIAITQYLESTALQSKLSWTAACRQTQSGGLYYPPIRILLHLPTHCNHAVINAVFTQALRRRINCISLLHVLLRGEWK